MFTIILAGCLYEFFKVIKKINPDKQLKYFLFSIIYIVLPILLMIDLGINYDHYTAQNNQNNDLYFPLFPSVIIFSIWINDTMAYIVGSIAGKTQLTKISPNKTWEGTIGGALLCVILISLLSQFVLPAQKISIYHWMHIAIICALFGTLGDLLESKLKRMAAIKDTGSLMPGHGGFLDRFDSLLVATPFVWLYINMFL